MAECQAQLVIGNKSVNSSFRVVGSVCEPGSKQRYSVLHFTSAVAGVPQQSLIKCLAAEGRITREIGTRVDIQCVSPSSLAKGPAVSSLPNNCKYGDFNNIGCIW